MPQIPSTTIETFARSIFRETSGYGFGQVDLLRLVNELMDLSTNAAAVTENAAEPDPPAARECAPGAGPLTSLPLEGESVKIRALDENGDADVLREWLSDKYGRYFLLSCATAQTTTVSTLLEGDSNHLAIVTLHDGTPVGAMAYLDHNPGQKRAELRKLIGAPEARGKGLAEEATRLWIDYGLDALGLEKIYVSTLQTHIANIKLNEAIGFRIEGLLRNEVLIDGKRHDVLRMGLWFD